jgi:WD40 repeat protein
VNTLSGHTDVVRNLAFSPNGARLASASADGTILLWRVSDGTLETSCTGHRAGVNSVAFSPNSQLLVSGSDDATIKLWRASTGALLRTFDQETGTGVLSVQFSPDCRRLAYGRCDATVVMARLDQRAPAALDWARSEVGQWRQPNRRPWYAQKLPFVAMAYGAPTPGYISVRQLYERLAAEGKVKQTVEPGDLAFWGQWDPITGRGRSGGHLAVYAGDGRVISTPLSKREPVSEYTLMEVTSRLSRVRANFLGFAPAPNEWPGRSGF